MQPCYPESLTAATYDGQDPSNGIVASSDVPLPTRLEIRNCPPSVSTRSTNRALINGDTAPASELRATRVPLPARLYQIVVPTIWPMP
jgi:hypothetical protein